MARRKNDDTGSILLLIGAIVVAFAVVATPIALLIGWIIYSLRLDKDPARIRRVASAFWLDAEEKIKFRQITRELEKAKQDIARANQMGNMEDLDRNADGIFSRRTSLGRELREILEDAHSRRVTCTLDLAKYRILPQDRWRTFRNDAIKAYKWSRACRAGFFAWCISIAFGIIIEHASLENGALIAIPTVAAIISALISWITFTRSDNCQCTSMIPPKPPEVSLENVDCYGEDRRQMNEGEAPRAESSERSEIRQASSIDEESVHAKVLGLEGDINPVIVKKKYHELLAQYHPDKVANLGAELKRVANDETRRIIEAYEYFSHKFNNVQG